MRADTADFPPAETSTSTAIDTARAATALIFVCLPQNAKAGATSVQGRGKRSACKAPVATAATRAKTYHVLNRIMLLLQYTITH